MIAFSFSANNPPHKLSLMLHKVGLMHINLGRDKQLQQLIQVSFYPFCYFNMEKFYHGLRIFYFSTFWLFFFFFFSHHPHKKLIFHLCSQHTKFKMFKSYLKNKSKLCNLMLIIKSATISQFVLLQNV